MIGGNLYVTFFSCKQDGYQYVTLSTACYLLSLLFFISILQNCSKQNTRVQRMYTETQK